MFHGTILTTAFLICQFSNVRTENVDTKDLKAEVNNNMSNVNVFASTLTTAKYHKVSVYPTTFHTGIFVDMNIYGKSTHLDLFTVKAQDTRRKGRHDVWNWDYWCQLQPQAGNCSNSVQRYYYDAQLDQCTTFTFTGCRGNKNNFEKSIECERHCKGAIYMGLKASDGPTFCLLQPDAGHCLAYIKKFYFDVKEGKCKSFVYGGCGGNHNRFNDAHSCKNICQISMISFYEYGQV